MPTNPLNNLGGVSDDVLLAQGAVGRSGAEGDGNKLGSSRNLETILRIPIVMQVVLGTASMTVSQRTSHSPRRSGRT